MSIVAKRYDSSVPLQHSHDITFNEITASAKSDKLPVKIPEPIQVKMPEPETEPMVPAHITPAPVYNSKSQIVYRDPVCGVKGRTYYIKKGGWRAWRCNR